MNRSVHVTASGAFDRLSQRGRPFISVGAHMSSTPDLHLHTADHEDLAVTCTSTTVLITASSPVHVEILARRIHGAGSLARFPLVQTSARALPRDIAALRDICTQLFTAASGGTLLLTDVEEATALAQQHLLAHLDELQMSAPVRLIAGTTVSLIDRVAAGTFSEQLFYRLNVIHLVV